MPPDSPANTRALTTATTGSARDAIIEAAIEILADHGYGGMRIQQVATAVGLQKGSLFHHFSGKENLAAAAVRSVQQRFLQLVEPLASTEPPSLQQLDALVDRLVEFSVQQPAAAHLALRTFIDPVWPPSVFKTPESLEASIFEILCGWLQRAGAAGVTRKLDPRTTVFHVMGMALLYPAAARSEGTAPAKLARAARKRWSDELHQMVRGALAP